MAYVDFPINSHLERLAYDPIREKPSLFGDTWMSMVGASFAYGTVALNNAANFKPLYTGIWKYAVAIPLGVAAGVWFRDWRRERLRDKWAKITHYIQLHPEDFPPYPPRTKVGSTLAPWIPIRTGW